MRTAIGEGGGVVFGFDGHITIGGQTFTGSVSGLANAECFGECTDTLPAFVLSGTSASGSFTATCTGELITNGTTGEAGVLLGEGFSPVIGGGVSDLSCNGSANGGPRGHVTLVSEYKADGYSPWFNYIAYSGVFEGA